jgi:hypothetical protein
LTYQLTLSIQEEAGGKEENVMETVHEFWRPIINDFNPLGQVRPEDIERFFVDRNEDDPTRSLLRLLDLKFRNSRDQPKPYKALLTGHVGSGKSSELMRLGQQLADSFFVVWFDAETSLVIENANHFDILLGMGLTVYQGAEAAQLKPDKRLVSSLLTSLSKFVRKYEERKGFSLNLGQLIKQVFSMVFVAGASAIGGPVAAGAACRGL